MPQNYLQGGEPAIPAVIRPDQIDKPVAGPAAPTPSPSPAPRVKSSPAKPAVQDFSKTYGLYNGTVFDKTNNEGITSDAEFKKRTGYSSNGQTFDTSYIPPTVLSSQNINKPITSQELEQSINLPEPATYVGATGSNNLNAKVTAVANTVLKGTQTVLDSLYKEQEKMIAAEKAAAEAKVKQGTDALEKIVTSSQYADTQQAINDRLNVEANIKKYQEIQTKIVGAQEALNMGLIYEGDRPARTQLILGRQASLQKQGLASIGALQAVGEVIKGNIDLATAYATSTLNAMKEDDNRQYTTLTTLLNLNKQNLVNLTDEEKDIVNKRIENIGNQIKETENNKNDVLDLLTKYPDAFLSGGVTLLDSRETALQKMLPKLAAKERQQFDLEMAAKRKSLAGSTTKNDEQKDKSLLLEYKGNGMTYDEAILRFGDTLSLDYIAGIYGRSKTDPNIKAEDAIKNAFYGQYLNPDGSVKTGTNITIDPKNGRPVVSAQEENSGGGVINWFKNLFN